MPKQLGAMYASDTISHIIMMGVVNSLCSKNLARQIGTLVDAQVK